MTRVAVLGAGWAGLAAAVRAVEEGARVTVFEMAPEPGGRARSVHAAGATLDNGQHILIGAYSETLALMRTVGTDPEALLLRGPLRIDDLAGPVLPARRGRASVAFLRAVLAAPRWPFADRLALLAGTFRWMAGGFQAPADQTVAELAAALPRSVVRGLLEPLCVAALNTPADRASAAVFLRVMKDAVFGAPGASDLLLPRAPLGELMPEPAWRWLAAHDAALHTGRRVHRLRRDKDGWRIDDETERFDGVVIATSAVEAARLALPFAPAWSATAAALEFEAIVTIYLRLPASAARPDFPMLALDAADGAPAQFAFDLDTLRGIERTWAVVASGASEWVDRGGAAVEAAMRRQIAEAFGIASPDDIEVVHRASEKRATFTCTPGLVRPAAWIASGCIAAGDYVEGPYPATLEGAVRSGSAAARSIGSARGFAMQKYR